MNTPSPQIIWQPQEGPQTALLQCPVFEVFYGGARGGGKTESSIGDWLEHSSQYGEAAIGIFVRRKFKQLAEVIARTKQLFPKIGARYNEQKAEWRMANGARLKFVYLERDSDAEEYQGHNYTRVYIEEVTNFPSPAPINKLRATLRSGSGVPVGMRLTGNPGGPGHNWVKKRYIDPAPEGFKVIYEEEDIVIEGEPQTIKIDRVFIPSKLGDNVLLVKNDPTYILRLRQSGSEQLVKAWLEGNWDIVDGAFFDEFSEEAHVRPSNWILQRTPQTILFRAFDWGSARPFSVGWYAICDGLWPRHDPLPAGAIFKYREWYGAKGVNVGLKMSAKEIARSILEMEKGEIIRYAVADPSIFIRNGGPSINELMFQCRWRAADNKRRPGWEQVRQRLVGDSGKPMLYIGDECQDTIRTLPILQHDEKDLEDLDTDGEDHAADELRYACMSRVWRPAKPRIEQGISYPKLPSQMTINEIIAKRTHKRELREADNGW
jgi:Terminase large subunit, T4likevirus-type, N-terminal